MDSLLKVLAHFIEVCEEELKGVSNLSCLTPQFLHSFLSTCTDFWLVPDSLLRPPEAVGSDVLALLLKTPAVNLNLDLLRNNVMKDMIEDWCIPQHDESPTNPAEAWKVSIFISSAQ